MKVLKSLSLLLVFIALSCTKSDKFDTTIPELKTYELITNKTVSGITSTVAPTVILTDDVIEAYVTSTDAGGTFYKSISFQDTPTGTPLTRGFSILVDKSPIFSDGFIPGRKVFIKLKGLAIATIFGSKQIGLLDPKNTTKLVGISELDYLKFLFPSAKLVDENLMVSHFTLEQAATDLVQNRLIEIDNVQFADNSLARTFYDIDSGGFATNHDIIDVTLGGTTRFCRISQFAIFSSHDIPSGSGTIRGVMSKYNLSYQFTVRTENDFRLNNPRSYNFNGVLSENFSSFPSTNSYNTSTSFTNFPSYLNFATFGLKKWYVKTGGSLEMSSYGFNPPFEKSVAYFLVPVDFAAANSLKFDLSVGFLSGGLCLKIFRTTDFVPGKKISDTTLIDITSNFNLPTASTTGFVNSGIYNIPSNISEKGFFVFEYKGTNSLDEAQFTTTIGLDNININ